MLTKNTLRTRILLIVLIVVLANILVSKFFFRLDFTGDKRYTLSDATKNILQDLEEPVTITAYFSENLPPQIDKAKRDFQDLLVEYDNRSNGNVVYEFVNPNESQEKEQEAMSQGISPQVVSVRERDQIKQQRIYLGAKLQYGEDSEIIPVIQPGAAMEYALSSSIKKISVSNKPKVGFISGHGEANPGTMQEAAKALEILYDVETASLSDTSLVSTYSSLVIVAPTDSFKQAELENLDRYLASGKGALLAVNRVKANLQTATGEAVTTGLENWLTSKGIQVNAEFVIDSKCGAITVQNQQGFFSFQQQVPFPYLPLVSNFTDHPISKGLEQLILPFASSLTYTPVNNDFVYTPFAKSSGRSGTEGLPVSFDVEKQLEQYGFFTSNLTLAATLEGNLSGNVPSKLVVFGDGDFAVNGEGQSAQRLQADNVNLFVNAVDWLSDDTGLTELRTKGITSRPIEKELSDSQKGMVKWLNFLLPIGLILVYGLIRAQARNRRKLKWASERYS